MSTVKSAYPEAFTPCARYDPNAAVTRPPSIAVDGQSGRGSSGDLSHQQDDEGISDKSEKRAHQRSSSYPSRTYNFSSGDSPAVSPSISARGHQPKGSYDGSYASASQGYRPRSPVHVPPGYSPSPGHFSHGQPPLSPGSLQNGQPPHSPGSQGYPSNGYTGEPQQPPHENGTVGAGLNGALQLPPTKCLQAS